MRRLSSTAQIARRTLLVRGTTLALLAATVCTIGLSGCQTWTGGQTLPSAYYLRDDIQFFPAGPEFQLTNQVQQIEEYNARRAGIDVADPAF